MTGAPVHLMGTIRLKPHAIVTPGNMNMGTCRFVTFTQLMHSTTPIRQSFRLTCSQTLVIPILSLNKEGIKSNKACFVVLW